SPWSAACSSARPSRCTPRRSSTFSSTISRSVFLPNQKNRRLLTGKRPTQKPRAPHEHFRTFHSSPGSHHAAHGGDCARRRRCVSSAARSSAAGSGLSHHFSQRRL